MIVARSRRDRLWDAPQPRSARGHRCDPHRGCSVRRAGTAPEHRRVSGSRRDEQGSVLPRAHSDRHGHSVCPRHLTSVRLQGAVMVGRMPRAARSTPWVVPSAQKASSQLSVQTLPAAGQQSVYARANAGGRFCFSASLSGLASPSVPTALTITLRRVNNITGGGSPNQVADTWETLITHSATASAQPTCSYLNVRNVLSACA